MTYLGLQLGTLRISIFSLVLKLPFCEEFENLPHGLIFTPVYKAGLYYKAGVKITCLQTFSVKDQMVSILGFCGPSGLWQLFNSAFWCENNSRLCK